MTTTPLTDLTSAAALGANAAKWMTAGLSTAPADREAAADAARLAYRSAGLPAPAHVVWFASPAAGARAAALLTGRRDLPGATSGALDADIAGELRAQGCPPVPGTAGVSVRAAVRTAPWAAARAEVHAELGPDGWAHLWSACGADVWRMVNDRVASPLRTHLRAELPTYARAVLLDAVGGQHDAGWLAAFDAAASRASVSAEPGSSRASAAREPAPPSARASGTAGTAVASGTAGSVRSAGAFGTAGPAGSAGTAGPAGSAGIAGPAGSAGTAGSVRSDGAFGTAGSAGSAGASAGSRGSTAFGAAGSSEAGTFGAPGAVLRAAQRLAGLAGVARTAGWWWPYANVAILTDRPDELHRDNIGRLHAADTPALHYSDGFALHAWRGMPIPSDLVHRLANLTHRQIASERNAELRRVMLEHFGYERYLREAGARRLSSDETGVLWQLTFTDDEPLTMVEVVNSTPEPDGTSRVYWLRVPPRTRTAREGVAWTFGLTAEEYHPLVQT